MPGLADQFMQDAGAGGVAGPSLSAQFAADISAQEKTAAAVPDAAKRSKLDEIGHQVGLTARAGVAGVMGIPNMLGDALNSGINLVTTGVNKVAGTKIPQLELPSHATQNLMDLAGVAKPENGAERVAQAVASSMVGVKPSVQLGQLLAKSERPVAQAIGESMQTAPGMQILGSGGAGAGSALANEAGYGPVAQIIAGLSGAAVGAGVGTGITRLGRSGAAPSASSLGDVLAEQPQPGAIPPGGIKPRIKLNADGSTVELPQPVPAFPSPAESTTVPAVPSATEVAKSAPKYSKTEQAKRIETLKALGIEEQRPSTYTGDAFQGAQEYQTSKLDTPIGKTLRDQFEKEQEAVKNYAGAIVESAGGAPGADMVTRGTTITAPLNGLAEHFDQQIKTLYNAANEASGGAASISLDGLGGLLKTNSVFAGKAENAALRRGINAYMKEQGIVTKDGLQPIDAQTAEGLRQYLNSQWSPQNSGLIGKIKEALDLDVTKSAGEDVYKAARQLHAERKNTLDNPKGIASILQEEGPNGINRQVPLEQVASRTINMPVAQFKHVVDTLKNMPTPELQQQSVQAINEMRRQMAETIYAAGVGNGKTAWNASAVTKALNTLRPKLNMIFTTDEINKFRILNDGGHILNTDRSYPGAAAQGYNMLQSGAIKLGPYIGAAGGMASGSPTAGYLAGKGASSIIQGWADKSNAAKLAEMLRNPAPK